MQASLYGIEALQVLRVEKGYLHIGTDTDGTTLPMDVGFARDLSRKSAAFVGRRSLLRPAARDPQRLQLIGLVPVDGSHGAPGRRADRAAAAPDPDRRDTSPRATSVPRSTTRSRSRCSPAAASGSGNS